MSDISLTVASSDKEALVAGATMLLTLAGKVPAMELDDVAALAEPVAFVVEEVHASAPGPFYWQHEASGSCGICATQEELEGTIANAPDQIDEITADDIRAHRTAGWQVHNPHGLAIPEAAAVPPPPIAASAGAPAGPASSTSTAPASDGAASGASPSSVELDAEGLPWDGRIHARTKTKTANLHWKKKRGVEAAVYQTVVNELRAVMAAPPGVASESASEATPPIPNAAESFATQSAPVATPSVATPSVATPPVATAVEAPATFPEFLKAVSGLIGSQATTMEAVVGILNTHSVPNMQMMGNRADLIPQVWFDIQASINA